MRGARAASGFGEGWSHHRERDHRGSVREGSDAAQFLGPATARNAAANWKRILGCYAGAHGLSTGSADRTPSPVLVPFAMGRPSRIRLFNKIQDFTKGGLVLTLDMRPVATGGSLETMGQGDAERLAVLDLWWMAELFSPQTVPKLDRTLDWKKVVDWQTGDSLPWESLPRPAQGRVWQHTIYLGLYDLNQVYETLHRVFHDDRDAYDARPPGQSACVGVVVDSHGTLLAEASVLSSCAWALGRVHLPGPRDNRWMEGFDEANELLNRHLTSWWDDRRESRSDGESGSLDGGALEELAAIGRNFAGVASIPGLAADGIRIRSIQVSERTAAELSEFDFMNSFFLTDLLSARQSVRDNSAGAALQNYLMPTEGLRVSQRVDVRTHPHIVTTATRAGCTPPGRWPTNPHHPLALSQQFAVNQALEGLTDAPGLLGINGPPGTGKTTLLRDLIAGNIVERARRMADLPDPKDAFVGEPHEWRSGKYTRKVPRLRPELTGFEMVVASANNGAVENVTKEIPAASAIEDPWAGKIDHFTGLASAILAASRKAARDGADNTLDHADTRDPLESDDSAEAAWGLVAATLGNKANRSTFISSFWFAKGSAEDGLEGQGLKAILEEWQTTTPRTWKDARSAFQSAWSKVERLREERVGCEARLADLREIEDRLQEMPPRVEASSHAADVAVETAAVHASIEARSREERDQATVILDRHGLVKPSLSANLLSLGKSRRSWRVRERDLMTFAERAEALCRGVVGRGDELRARATQAREHRDALLREHADLLNRLAQLGPACAADKTRFGPCYPGPDWVGDARETSAAWLDPEFNIARSELFIAALRLHRDWIHLCVRDMKLWMRAVVEVLEGSSPKNLDPEALVAAWQLFFFFVPVVSTTFAAMPRMFADIDAERLGWLFIDEAGQCAPQEAVGAIWRAKRVVAVGDPMQLKPVTAIPHKALSDIAATYRVADVWVPPRASVQTLADRVGRFGTTLNNGEEPIWVSAPLRVHRRCDDPMFSISNAVAYEGLMVSAVHRKEDRGDLFLARSESGELKVPSSFWADTPADTVGSHLQGGQIDRLRKAIQYVHAAGVPYGQMFVLSPFRAVADKLEEIAKEHQDMRGGTIHTAQGREADVVFFVLGSATEKPGSRTWASEEPNLLNVAVSRAKRRLYVIGSHQDWSPLPYFEQLAAELRIRPASRK